MTISDFDKLINAAEDAAATTNDFKTVLIFLHKTLGLAKECAEYARISDECTDTLIYGALVDLRGSLHKSAAQILGFIQQLIREEDKGK